MTNELYQAADPSTMMGQAIEIAYESGVPDREIETMIAQQTIDQPEVMAKVIGWGLVREILG